MSEPALVARGVSVSLGGRVVLAGVDLEVRSGELVALCGPNGAGKTTLLRVLAGDLDPTSGSVALHGRPLSTWRPRELARERAVLPQQTTIEFAFTGREVVALGLRSRTGDVDERTIVDGALDATESSAFAGRLYARLSGGEAGRVNLSRVLAQSTEVVFLDEPTAALDVRHQALTMATARRLADEGRVVVAVLHDLNLASVYADRIVLMSAGRVRADGDPQRTLDAEMLSAVYDHPIAVVPHPFGAGPLVIPHLHRPDPLI